MNQNWIFSYLKNRAGIKFALTTFEKHQPVYFDTINSFKNCFHFMRNLPRKEGFIEEHSFICLQDNISINKQRGQS